MGCDGRRPRLLVLRAGVLAVLPFRLGEEWGILDRSVDPRGVETMEGVFWLFLRRGGKYPSVLRGIRAISVGFDKGEESRSTQRTCIHGESSSNSGRSADVSFCEELLYGTDPPLVFGGSSVLGVGARRSIPGL